MGKLRVLSGREVCAILEGHGFREVRQRGSHIVMHRVTDEGTTTVPVPDHRELRIGTLRSIIRHPGYLGPNLRHKLAEHSPKALHDRLVLSSKEDLRDLVAAPPTVGPATVDWSWSLNYKLRLASSTMYRVLQPGQLRYQA